MSRKTVPIFLILAGVLLILIGLSRGEANDVFSKAARICLECMGLGR